MRLLNMKKPPASLSWDGGNCGIDEPSRSLLSLLEPPGTGNRLCSIVPGTVLNPELTLYYIIFSQQVR